MQLIQFFKKKHFSNEQHQIATICKQILRSDFQFLYLFDLWGNDPVSTVKDLLSMLNIYFYFITYPQFKNHWKIRRREEPEYVLTRKNNWLRSDYFWVFEERYLFFFYYWFKKEFQAIYDLVSSKYIQWPLLIWLPGPMTKRETPVEL